MRCFSCAGVADGTPGIEQINFIGHRYLIDRLLANGHARRAARRSGSSRRPPASGWEANLPLLKEYLDIAGLRRRRRAGSQEHGKADYMWSKQAICAYVAREAMPLLRRGIRINAICPGPTDTPLAQANKETWLGFGSDYRAEVGVEASTPLEQAYPLVFLCSDAAAARGHGDHRDHRLRLLQRRRHRLVPRSDAGRQLPPRPLLTTRQRGAIAHPL